MSIPTTQESILSSMVEDIQQTQRRSACDRCRSHKLRCERNDSLQNCNRCIRAKAPCNTGDAGKPGRPPQLFGAKRRRRSQGEGVSLVEEASSDDVGIAGFLTPPSEHTNTQDNASVSQSSHGPVPVGSNTTESSMNDDFWLGGFLHDPTLAEYAPMNLDEAEIVTGSATNKTISQEELLRRLATLHSSVLEDISTIKSYKTIDKCLSATSGAMQNSNFMIGRMLCHADTFVDILHRLTSTPSPVSSASTNNRRTDDMTSHGQDETNQCDVPTKMSILSCYICIVRIYRTTLGCICDSIVLAKELGVSLPPIFPGLNLGGFFLDHKPLFHLQMLAQLSEDMLTKMDTALGFGGGSTNQRLGLFEKSSAAALLDMILKEEASELPPSDEGLTLCDPVRTTIARLKDLAR